METNSYATLPIRQIVETNLSHLRTYEKNINVTSYGFDCPLEIKQLHQKAISEVLTFHQVAYLKVDPEMDEISDSGLPNEEELKKHSYKKNHSRAIV